MKAIKAINFPLNIALMCSVNFVMGGSSSMPSRQVLISFLISFLIKDYVDACCFIVKSLRYFWLPFHNLFPILLASDQRI